MLLAKRTEVSPQDRGYLTLLRVLYTGRSENPPTLVSVQEMNHQENAFELPVKQGAPSPPPNNALELILTRRFFVVTVSVLDCKNI